MSYYNKYKCSSCGEQYTDFPEHWKICDRNPHRRTNQHRPVTNHVVSKEAPLPRTGNSEYQRNYTFNQDTKGSSAQNRSKSSAPVSKLNQVSIVKPTFKRSLLVQEFGTENKHGHLNCFLNVCLQALWQFPKVRADLQFMIDNRDAAGSQQIKPFINSLQDFYKQIITINSRQSTGDVPILKSNNVRTELFKLNYSRNEFSLHEKADAFEALDQVLTIIHLWQKSIEAKDGTKKQLADAGKLFCDEGETCFIHQSFGQSNVQQELCTCTKRSAVRNQDPNVFAYSINVHDVLSLLPQFKLSSKAETYYRNADEETKRVFATNQQLVTALKHMQTKEREGCAEDPSRKGHRTKTIACVETNPEVFIFNATWGENPTPSQIFKFMISIPERFKSNEIYDDNPEDTYILRGFFAFQGAHYISFFRRVFMKLDYLPVADYQKIAVIHKMMEAEVTSRTEWTIFDDSVIDHRGGWHDVVKQCVDIRMYPTVIFYEKLDPNENHPEPLDTSQIDDKKILAGFRNSKEADQNWGVGGGFGAEYDDSQIAQQLELMNEFSKQKSKENGGEDVKSTSIRVEQEETKVALPKITQPTSTKPLTLSELKKKYQEYGIYLFQCNKCEDGIFALHSKNCLKPGCGSENHFLQLNVCTDLGKWSECFRAIFKLRNWKIEPLQKPSSSEPTPGLNLSGQTLTAGEDQAQKEESKVSNSNKPPLQHSLNKLVQSQSLLTAPVQNLTNLEQGINNPTLQRNLNQTRDEDTQDLNRDQKTVQVEQTKNDENAKNTDTQKEVGNEEAKAIDLNFLRQSAPQVPEEESKFSYPKLDDYVTPGNPALLLKPDFANIGRPFAHQFQQSQQDIQHNQEQRVNQSLTNQNISYEEHDRLARSAQEETKGETDQSSQMDTKKQTNQAAKQESFERQEEKKRENEQKQTESSSDEANFKDDLEGKKSVVPTTGDLIKPASAFLDKGKLKQEDIHAQEQESLFNSEVTPRESDLETFSMFKCPRHGTFTELQQSCEACGRTIEFYISEGYQMETMLFEMTQQQLYQLIQEKERKNSKPEKKDNLNTSKQNANSGYHRTVTDTSLKESSVKNEKLQNDRNNIWECKECKNQNGEFSTYCGKCFILKTENDKKYLQLQQSKVLEEKKQHQTLQKMKCLRCKTEDEYKDYGYCISCRALNLAEGEQAQKDKQRQEELDAKRKQESERAELARQRDEQEKKDRERKCPNCQRLKASPTNPYCLRCMCKQCLEQLNHKTYDTYYDKCFDCLVKNQKAEQAKREQERLKLVAEQELLNREKQRLEEDHKKRQEAQEQEIKARLMLEKQEQEQKKRELEELKKKNDASLLTSQQMPTKCANCEIEKAYLSPVNPYCRECICKQCVRQPRQAGYNSCKTCIAKLIKKTEEQNKEKRIGQEEVMIAGSNSSVEDKLQRQTAEPQRMQDSFESDKRMICGICKNKKTSQGQLVCTSCMQSQQKICKYCKQRPALKESSGDMCIECKAELKKKYFCPECGAMKTESLNSCSAQCGWKQQQDSNRKVSQVCIKCGKNAPIDKHNICRDCLAKNHKTKCKRCTVKDAEYDSEYCAVCEYKVNKPKEEQRKCQECQSEIFSTELLCNFCRKLCEECGDNQVGNGDSICYVCKSGKSKKSKKQRPETASIKTSQSSKPKTIKCPKCWKNMLLKDVPIGGPNKVQQCMVCGKGSANKDILSYNCIQNFTEGVFEENKKK